MQNGDFTYSYPIQLPPGRGEQKPTLSLEYGSSGAIYGTVAQGWSLPLPAITKDISSSQLGITNSPSFRIGDTPLVELPEDLEEPMPAEAISAFRAEHDSDQARYFLLGSQAEFRWLRLSSDGSRSYFGRNGSYHDTVTGQLRPSLTGEVSPLALSIDAYGNEISYTVSWFGVDSTADDGASNGERATGFQLESIAYGANQAAGLSHHAEVRLNYNEPGGGLTVTNMRCPGFGPHIGTSISYRSGKLLAHGANWLTSIQVLADRDGDGQVYAGELVKRYKLTYNMSAARCNADYAPRRQLSFIEESSYNIDANQVATRPAVRFLYGDLRPSYTESSLSTPVPLDMAFASYSHSDHFTGYASNLHPLTRFADMDGDGLLDLLAVDPRPADDSALDGYVCTGYWLRNLGGELAELADAVPFSLPTIDWGDWGSTGQRFCDLSGQNAGKAEVDLPDYYPASLERFLDYVWEDFDGDGDTDLIVGGRYINYQDFEATFYPIATENGSDLLPGAYHLPPGNYPSGFFYHGDPLAHRGFRDGLGYKHYVFVNDQGVLANWPISKLQPAPVVGDESTFMQNRELMGYMDVNGDGIKDYVTYELILSVDSNHDYDVQQWVLFGDGYGNYKLDANGEAHRFFQGAGPVGQGACLSGGGSKCRYMGLFSGAGLTMPPVSVADSDQLTEIRTRSYSPHSRYDVNGDGLADMLSSQGWLEQHGEMRANESYADWGVPVWALNNGRSYDEGSTSAAWRDILSRGRDLSPDPGDFVFTDPRGEAAHGLIDLSYGVAETQWNSGDMNYLELGRSYKELLLHDVDEDGLLDRVYIDYDVDAAIKAPWDGTHGKETFLTGLHGGSYAKLLSAPDTSPERFQVAYNYMGVGFLPPRSLSSPDAAHLAQALSGVQDVARTDITFNGQDLPYLSVAEAGFDFPTLWRKESIGLTLDLDGDGYDEWITRRRGETDYSVFSRDVIDPPGLLTRIVHSGGYVESQDSPRNGGYTDINYRSIHDTTVVENDPSRGRVARTSRFVVHTLQHVPGVYPGRAPPKMDEALHYANPVWNRDLQGRWGFRGFERIERRHHVYYGLAGWTRVEEIVRDYDLSYRGLTVESAVRDELGHHLSKELTTWRRMALAGVGALDLFVPAWIDSYRCSGQETDWASCLHNRHELVYQTQHSVPMAGVEVPVFIEKTGTMTYDRSLFSGYPEEHGNRRSETRYALRYEGDVFRSVVTGNDSYAMEYVAGCDPEDGACSLEEERTGQQEVQWSADLLFAEEERQRAFEGGPWITTRRAYDGATGLITGTQMPNEVAQGGPWATVTYDPLRLFAAVERDPLGRAIKTTEYDYGTGQALVIEGPGYKCPGWTSNNTAIDCAESERVYAQQKMVVDPHGRTLEQWASFDGTHNAVPYTLKKIKRFEYDGEAFRLSGHPLVKREYTWLRNNEWTLREYLMDVFRRPLETTAYNADTGDTFQRFTYDGSGQIIEVASNDPSAAPFSSAEVSARFRYDVFGRQIQVDLPDPVTGVPGSAGLATSFLAPDTVETHELTSDGGPSASKIQRFDRFGNLIEVHERQHAGSDHVISARYFYDAAGHLRKIIDGDGIVTELDHDWLGRRTEIRRADKTWSYRYDLNSNVTDIIMPRPLGELEDAYTKHIEYDALSRVVRIDPATAGLTSQQLQDWHVGSTHFHYDLDTNGPGGLHQVDSPIARTTYTYDALGRTSRSIQELKLAGLAHDPLVTQLDYDGQLVDVIWTSDRDVSTTRYPRIEMRYDVAGMPVELEHQVLDTSDASLTVKQLAKVVRNAAGKVIARQGAHAAPTTPFAQAPIQATWQYDKQGRLVHLSAGVLSPTTGSVEEKVSYLASYYESGEIRTLAQSLGADSVDFSFTYDDRHMLEGVTTAAAGYDSSFLYSQGGRLASADVVMPPGALLGLDRAVDYLYNIDDPSELGTLASIGGGGDFARYEYDAAGNMLEREIPGQSHHLFAYDGDHRLREVTDLMTGEREVYYYQQDERIVARRYDAAGYKESSRRWFGETEVRYDSADARSESVQRVAFGQTVARIADAERIDYILTSPQGHTLLAVDDTGQIHGGAIYGPFGEILHKAGSFDEYPRGFNGKDFDSASQLSYYGFRYYDPIGLIWNRPDPLYSSIPDHDVADPIRAHLYTFSGNNPVSLVDPDGRSPGTTAYHKHFYDKQSVLDLQKKAAEAKAWFYGGPQWNLNDVIRQATRGVGALKTVGGVSMMWAGGSIMMGGAETLNPLAVAFGAFVFGVGGVEVATGMAQTISGEWLGDTITKAATELTGSSSAGWIIGKTVRFAAKAGTGSGAFATETLITGAELKAHALVTYYNALGDKVDRQGKPSLVDVAAFITPIQEMRKTWTGKIAKHVVDSLLARGFVYAKSGVIYDFKGFNSLSKREHAMLEKACHCDIPYWDKKQSKDFGLRNLFTITKLEKN